MSDGGNKDEATPVLTIGYECSGVTSSFSLKFAKDPCPQIRKPCLDDSDPCKDEYLRAVSRSVEEVALEVLKAHRIFVRAGRDVRVEAHRSSFIVRNQVIVKNNNSSSFIFRQ